MKTTACANKSANTNLMQTIITWTPAKKEAAIQMLTAYFQEHGTGEAIQQSDDAIINAPTLLVNIADDILIEGQGIVYNWNDEDY